MQASSQDCVCQSTRPPVCDSHPPPVAEVDNGQPVICRQRLRWAPLLLLPLLVLVLRCAEAHVAGCLRHAHMVQCVHGPAACGSMHGRARRRDARRSALLRAQACVLCGHGSRVTSIPRLTRTFCCTETPLISVYRQRRHFSRQTRHPPGATLHGALFCIPKPGIGAAARTLTRPSAFPRDPRRLDWTASLQIY